MVNLEAGDEPQQLMSWLDWIVQMTLIEKIIVLTQFSDVGTDVYLIEQNYKDKNLKVICIFALIYCGSGVLLVIAKCFVQRRQASLKKEGLITDKERAQIGADWGWIVAMLEDGPQLLIVVAIAYVKGGDLTFDVILSAFFTLMTLTFTLAYSYAVKIGYVTIVDSDEAQRVKQRRRTNKCTRSFFHAVNPYEWEVVDLVDFLKTKGLKDMARDADKRKLNGELFFEDDNVCTAQEIQELGLFSKSVDKDVPRFLKSLRNQVKEYKKRKTESEGQRKATSDVEMTETARGSDYAEQVTALESLEAGEKPLSVDRTKTQVFGASDDEGLTVKTAP